MSDASRAERLTAIVTILPGTRPRSFLILLTACGCACAISVCVQTHQRQSWVLASIGKNKLKVLRAERDWTQERLATELDVARQTIIAIEKSKFDPGLALTFRIARVFNLPIVEIFEPED